MKKLNIAVLLLLLVLTCDVQIFASETKNRQFLAEEILQKYADGNLFMEFAYLPQAYLLLEEALILDPNNYHVQGLMAEYLIQASDLLGYHPKKAIKILEGIPSFGNEERDSLIICRLGRAYYLDGQREKALSILNDYLSVYEDNEAVKIELAKILADEEKSFLVSFYPILPFNDLVLGAGVTAKYNQFSPEINCSYELSHNLFYYDLSTKYFFTPLSWAELGYYRESNSIHPGYHYRDGFATQFTYDNGLGDYLSVAFFDGEIGRGDKQKEPLHTQLASISVDRNLYDDWGKK